MTCVSRLQRVMGVVVAAAAAWMLPASGALAQTAAPATAGAQAATKPGGHEPPPQAYADCKGKKAGERVRHSTPEGVVDAECLDSPKGLVARPVRTPPQGAASAPKR